ncbi:MAG: hypothetical protein ACLVHV_11165 [Oscillospiraceae bacterium]
MPNLHYKPHMPVQPVNMKSAWGKLLAFSRPWLPIGITGMVLAMVASVFALMGPDQLRDMTNTIQAGILGDVDLNAIFRTGMTLVILYGLAAIGHYIQHFLMATFTQRVSRALRQSISRKINKVPPGLLQRSQLRRCAQPGDQRCGHHWANHEPIPGGTWSLPSPCSWARFS